MKGMADLALLDNIRIPDYQERLRQPQVKTDYGLFIYMKELIHLTTGTKRKKAITTSKYKKINRKPYKNLEWLNRMYERRMSAMGNLDEEDKDLLYKVVLPLSIPKNYKIYDHEGNYYGTVMEEDDLFYYTAVKKDTSQLHYFMKDFVEKMYVQAQCGGRYGFIVPEEFYKNYERPG